MARTDFISLWVLRVAWASLPLTAGGALAQTADSWSSPVRLVAEALAWATWVCVLVAVGAPRPLSLSVVRTAVPIATVAILVAAVNADGWQRWTAAVAILVACVLALSPGFAVRAVDGASYGDERRVPLRIPPGLFFGPLPLAVVVIGAGVVSGPVLVAARAWVIGVVALAVGLPAALVAARAVHALSARMVVLVPAGLVLADPSTINDAVLFRRETVRAIVPLDADSNIDRGLDLRLGARRGSVGVELSPDADAVHVRRGRRDSEAVDATAVLCAIVRSDDFLALAASRRLPVRTAS